MKTPDQTQPNLDIPPELDDLEKLTEWVSPEALKDKNHRAFSGFEIYDDIDGGAMFLNGERKLDAITGTRIKVLKGTPHGFDIKEGDIFKFVSIQNPPIKDHHTGEEDFHLVDLV